MHGDDGNDNIIIASFDGTTVAYGGSGNDIFDIDRFDHQIYGGDGNDHVRIRSTSNQSQNDVFGGNGTDSLTLDIRAMSLRYITGHTLDIRASGPDQGGTIISFFSGQWRRLDFEIAGFESVAIYGYAGDDRVIATAGNDTISVHQGQNTVEGGAGTDLISYVTEETNLIDGGAGRDTLVVSAGSQMTFTATGASATDTHGSVIRNIEQFQVRGSGTDDQITLGSGNDTLYGMAGNDQGLGAKGNDGLFGGDGRDDLRGGDGYGSLSGDGGNDSLSGDNGNDRLSGGDAHDTLFGGANRDNLSGGAGNDRLFGGTGRYVLDGNAGADTLTGGGEADVFRFSFLEQGANADVRADTITDLQAGLDRIGVSAAMLGGALAPGALDPSRLSFGAASGSDLQFVLVTGGTGAASSLYLDTNGAAAGGATLLALLADAPAITAEDFFVF